MDLAELTPALEDPELTQYVGQWRRLVSTTNWDKGRIISAWREAAIQRDARLSEYSDEAWSRLVGGISPQHVGRLRRVYHRYAGIQSTFDGLYWSHFHAALEWEDGEMWLEGAVQNRWSVSQMRHQRWEALGGQAPVESDVVETELDEDLPLAMTDTRADEDAIQETTLTLPAPPADRADSTADGALHADGQEPPSHGLVGEDSLEPIESTASPFIQYTPLPLDLEDAIESLKVAILRHKLAGWHEVSADTVLASLDALKGLVVGT